MIIDTLATNIPVMSTTRECVICYEAPEKFIALCCHEADRSIEHILCVGCYEEYTDQQSSCPICRVEYDPEDLYVALEMVAITDKSIKMFSGTEYHGPEYHESEVIDLTQDSDTEVIKIMWTASDGRTEKIEFSYNYGGGITISF